MSGFVCVDASFILALVFQDEQHHQSAKILVGQLAAQNIRFCAPAMFAYECDSIIRLRVYKGASTLAEASQARSFIEALSILVEYDPIDAERAFKIATDYGQARVYDATYAAHAEARNVELVTIDAPFFEAVNGSKIPKTVPPLSFVKLLK